MDKRDRRLRAVNRSMLFHAAPPRGEWLNDPNGIVFAGGLWRVFAQHRADAPAYRATGWARLSSPDLLRWTWDGPVLLAGEDWHYSGSVTALPAGLRAWHTLHRDGLERQVRRDGDPTGSRWSSPQPLPELGPPQPNRRDPFVRVVNGVWTMLLAAPCDWHAGGADRSSLIAYASDDGAIWRETMRIGPWHPPGVMWEVPVLTRLGEHEILLVSTVDRRHGAAACAVFGWVGRWNREGFQRHPACPPCGMRVDLGPDFYAAMTSDTDGFCMAWLSSWATARDMPWPGFSGGPLSLPRELTLDWDGAIPRIGQRIVVDAAFNARAEGPPGLAVASAAASDRLTVSVCGFSQSLSVVLDPVRGQVSVARAGLPALAWQRAHTRRLATRGRRRVHVYIDGPAVEVAFPDDALVASVALAPAALGTTVEAAGAELPLAWFAPAQS